MVNRFYSISQSINHFRKEMIMPRLKLQILPDEEIIKESKKEKLSIIEKHWDSKKLAIKYLRTGLERDCQIMSDDIFCSRMGIIQSKISLEVIKQAKSHVHKLVSEIIKEYLTTETLLPKDYQKKGKNYESKT